MIKSKSWRLIGGLDLVRDPLTRHRYPGALLGVNNYESRDEGYRRFQGYERFDGRKAPSDISSDESDEETAQTETRRMAIGEVPGSGSLWVWRYGDKTYAFTDDSSGVMAMYVSSPSGWERVVLGWRVAFTAGSGDAPENGESVANSSSVTGEVVGHYLTSGSWAGGDAAGEIVFSYSGATRFAASDSITVDSDNARTLTISAVPTQQAIGAGTTFRFINYNFFGRAGSDRMYGVSGAGLPFEYDGTMFLELNTGVTGFSPTQIAAYQNHLFVGYKEGSAVHSGVGNPRSYAANDGAGEIAIGDTLTGFVAGFRDVLFILGRNRTQYVSGTSAADFKLVTLSDEAGAMEDTVALMDEPVCLDDRGIRSLSTTEAYGDFSIATISDRIRPILDTKRDGGFTPVVAIRVRRKSQYRLWFSDGDCIVVSYIKRGGRLTVEFTRLSLDLYDSDGEPDVGVPVSACSIEDSDGRERIFFTMKDSRHVYEMDSGISFDGYPVSTYMRLPYNDLGTPDIIKQFKKILLELDSAFRTSFQVAVDFDDDREEGARPGQSHEVLGPAAFWGEADWGRFYWATRPVRTAGQRISGRGRNLSVVLFSNPQEIEEPHLFSGLTVQYIDRKLRR